MDRSAFAREVARLSVGKRMPDGVYAHVEALPLAAGRDQGGRRRGARDRRARRGRVPRRQVRVAGIPALAPRVSGLLRRPLPRPLGELGRRPRHGHGHVHGPTRRTVTRPSFIARRRCSRPGTLASPCSPSSRRPRSGSGSSPTRRRSGRAGPGRRAGAARRPRRGPPARRGSDGAGGASARRGPGRRPSPSSATGRRSSGTASPRRCRRSSATGTSTGGGRVFDYGCGRGDDVRILGELGVDAPDGTRTSPPANDRRAADVVNLGFVVNVIEDLDERRAAARGRLRAGAQGARGRRAHRRAHGVRAAPPLPRRGADHARDVPEVLHAAGAARVPGGDARPGADRGRARGVLRVPRRRRGAAVPRGAADGGAVPGAAAEGRGPAARAAGEGAAAVALGSAPRAARRLLEALPRARPAAQGDGVRAARRSARGAGRARDGAPQAPRGAGRGVARGGAAGADGRPLRVPGAQRVRAAPVVPALAGEPAAGHRGVLGVVRGGAGGGDEAAVLAGEDGGDPRRVRRRRRRVGSGTSTTITRSAPLVAGADACRRCCGRTSGARRGSTGRSRRRTS